MNELLGNRIKNLRKAANFTQEEIANESREKDTSSKKIFDMLDLFYANKHMYAKLQKDAE